MLDIALDEAETQVSLVKNNKPVSFGTALRLMQQQRLLYYEFTSRYAIGFF